MTRGLLGHLKCWSLTVTVNGYFEQLSGHNEKKQRRKMEETIAGVQVSEVDSLYHSSDSGEKRKK